MKYAFIITPKLQVHGELTESSELALLYHPVNKITTKIIC